MQPVEIQEYRCAVCDAPVSKVPSMKTSSSFEYVRDCGHDNVGIVANIKAKCEGKGTLK